MAMGPSAGHTVQIDVQMELEGSTAAPEAPVPTQYVFQIHSCLSTSYWPVSWLVFLAPALNLFSVCLWTVLENTAKSLMRVQGPPKVLILSFGVQMLHCVMLICYSKPTIGLHLLNPPIFPCCLFSYYKCLFVMGMKNIHR